MTERDRLAADLCKTHDDYWDDPYLTSWSEFYADRLIDLGWRNWKDRKGVREYFAANLFDGNEDGRTQYDIATMLDDLADLVAGYEEDTDAMD